MKLWRQLTNGVLHSCRGRHFTLLWTTGAWLGTAGLADAQYSIVDLGDLGGGFARARAINDLGQVAGEALLPGAGALDQAVLWQSGMVADLGTLGGLESAAYGINNAGTVCGWAGDTLGNAMPAVWHGSMVTALPTLGGNTGTAYGLNDAGAAVGSTSVGNGSFHATLWSGGAVSDLGTLGGTRSVAYDINNQGVAVGAASDSSGLNRAVLWGASGPVDLSGLSGGQWTTAYGINDAGQVILWGAPQGASANQAAFWNGDPSSPVVTLGTFGGAQSYAYGLNNQGFVVGVAYKLDGTYHAFVWDGTGKTDLGTLGGYYSWAYGINDQGDIVGFAMDDTEQTHAVEWLPVPEPAAPLLGLLGMSIFSVFRRPSRRQRLGVAHQWPKIQSGRGLSES